MKDCQSCKVFMPLALTKPSSHLFVWFKEIHLVVDLDLLTFWKRSIFTWQLLWRRKTAVCINLQQKSSLYRPHTNPEVSCDHVINLCCLTETCIGEKRFFFSIVALLDAATITCTINVHKASVMMSLRTPEQALVRSSLVLLSGTRGEFSCQVLLHILCKRGGRCVLLQ